MPTFTQDQKKAHDHQRHISITANAGSGKTSVLVSRYVDLVEYRSYTTAQIAAITFTEKAASELRARIAREIDNRLNDESHKECWDLLKRVREKFPSAVVTTIHGFCSQILREFPIECDVSPTFKVVSGYERTEMEEIALMEAIETALADEPDAQFEGAFDTARRISREQMENILRMMMREREAIQLSVTEGPLSYEDEVLLNRWRSRLDSAIKNLLLNAESRPTLYELIDHLHEDLADEARQLLNTADRSQDASEFLGAMTRLLQEILLTKSGEPRKKSYALGKDEYDVLDDAVSTISRVLSGLEDFLQADSGPEIHELLLADTRQILEIYHLANRLYQGRKDQIGGLDFEDLQLALYNALESDDVTGRISGRFNYIMVDEFQDTNELQYRIVRKMARNLVDIDLLCVVGDRKQSIYGFRGAEVEVFAQATREALHINRDKERGSLPLLYRREIIPADSRDEELGVINLAASFRLLPSICAFVNVACAPVMKSSGPSEFGVEYEPLVCARRSNGRGGVEVLLAEKEPTEEDADPERPYVRETELIARRIVDMVTSGEELVWECPDGGTEELPRPVRFSDIAILCRKRKTFELLEQDLRAKGIPFMTHGSSGYFRTQEIYDIVNYLRSLLNYRDDVALIGLLRSPYFAISDTELYRISRQTLPAGVEKNFWSRSMHWIETGEPTEELVRAFSWLSDDRTMASRIPVSLLLKRIIERTGWRGAVIGTERGDQMLANIDKLIDLARDFELRGFTNLFDFVERVSSQIELEEMEAEAAINLSRDAVRLMTMHGAKGLEYPVVFLPELDSPTRVTNPPFLDKSLGFGWNWSFNGEDFRPAITALMKLRQRERERAEEARIFYVALTRARDYLILSGTCGDEPRARTMLEWGLAPLGSVPPENADVRVVARELGFLEEDGTSVRRVPWEQHVRVIRNIDDPGRYQHEDHLPAVLDQSWLQIGEIPARARGEIYSATQFLTYSLCPTRYYLRYRLGLPEELSEAWLEDEHADDSDDGTTLARLFRAALPHLDAMWDSNHGRADQSAIEEIVDDILILEPMEREESARLRARLIETFVRLLSSNEARLRFRPENASHDGVDGTTSLKELRMPLGTPPNREFVLGVMDRFVEDDQGLASFVQFKTARVAPDQLEGRAETYLPQLRLYAWLISQLRPRQRTISGSIIFTELPDRPLDFSFSRFDLSRIEEEIRATVEDIRQLSYTGRRDLPIATPHCPVCPYWIENECLLGRTAMGDPLP